MHPLPLDIIMRTRLTLWAALSAGLLAFSPVCAETPPLMPVPDIPPPPGMVETEMEPTVTIVQRGEDRVEEYRLRGRLYMIKVSPKVGKPYYLVDPRGDGQMRRFDDLSPNFVVPMWMIWAF